MRASAVIPAMAPIGAAHGDPSFHTVGRLSLFVLFERASVRPMDGDTEMLVGQPGATQILHRGLGDGPIVEDGPSWGS